MDFDQLTPEVIFQAVEAEGFQPTGALFPMNSYENRVYQIQLEEVEPIIGKFYRPKRWSKAALAEEQQLVAQLVEHEVPAVQALRLQHPISESDYLGEVEGYVFALYPKFRGREHDEITDEDRKWLGRSLARLHNITDTLNFSHRITLNTETYGRKSIEQILKLDFIPADLKTTLQQTLEMVLQRIQPFFQTQLKIQPVHGDCHPGNILWNADGPHLIDFDDMVMAPAVQDIWMLFNGTVEEQKQQQDCFFSGYSLFREFDFSTLKLAEPLRTLRMMHHTAWIARRKDEGIFKKAFPYYEDRRYWETFLLNMKEQIGLLQDL